MKRQVINDATAAIRGLALAAALFWHAPAVADTRAASDAGPWWRDAVFYQVFVRSFADSTAGPRANDGVGDLRGLIERLDYLNDGDPETHDDLEVTALWLMPIMQSPSYHGYDTTDYHAVDDEYGTLDDLRRLLDQAHRRGIRIIIDLVLNHTSSKHPWFEAAAADPRSPKRRWYVWRKTDPGYEGPWNQRVWHERNGWWYYGVFSSRMPDLNYRQPEVTRQMLDVTRFWLQDVGVDGFRLDAIKHIIENRQQQEHTEATHEWLRRFYRYYKRINPDAITVGEVWTSSDVVSRYVGDQMDLAFEFDLAYAIIDSVNRMSNERVSAVQQRVLKLYPPEQYATFLANHDQNRVMSSLEGDVAKARLAATIQLLSAGVPFIYYGEEIGMIGTKPDAEIRTPMQWTPDDRAGFSNAEPWHAINGDHATVNVQTQAADPDSLLNHYRKLVRLRRSSPALTRGRHVPVESSTPEVYAFLRAAASGEAMLIVCNLSDRPIGDYALTLKADRLPSQMRPVERLHGVEAAAPRLTASGRVRSYRPIGELAPRTGYVVDLIR